MADEVKTGTETTGTETTTATTTAATGTETATKTGAETTTATATTTTATVEDWRKPFSLGDAAKADKLARYNGPADFAKAHWAAVDKVLEGNKRQPLPDNATPEQLAAYREANGIPSKPEDYAGLLKLEDGLVIGDDDKPIIAEFLKVAHAKNAAPGDVSDYVNWYFKNQEAGLEMRAQADQDATDQAEASLRDEWGPEFKKNMAISYNFLGRFPEGIRDSLKNGRLADGTPIFANPDIVKAFATFEREINPAASVLPGAGNTSAAGVEEKIAAYEKRMGTDSVGWSKDAAAQADYMALIDARNNMKRRAAAA
jgi:hypothetical protein